MQFNRRAPFSHGIEIEQDGNIVDSRIRNRTHWSWHRDGSGPMETDFGGQKNPSALLKEFFSQTTEIDNTWNWHSETGGGSGCGSHLHFHLCAVPGAEFDEEVEAWTIAYNTLVEMAPFFAPFFAHNWETGFRHSVSRWAAPQTTRLSPGSMERNVSNPSRPSRAYHSVTLNGASSYDNKPMTVEFRMNEAHPTLALTGAAFLRVIAKRCVEAGWSPKLDSAAMGYSSHDAALRSVYAKVYNRGDLIESMKETQEIVFVEDRGVNGQTEFDSAWEVLEVALAGISTDRGTYGDRVKKLVQAGSSEFGAQNNQNAIWNVMAPRGEFSWDNGPATE